MWVYAYTTILYTVQTLYFKLTKYSPKTVVKRAYPAPSGYKQKVFRINRNLQ